MGESEKSTSGLESRAIEIIVAVVLLTLGFFVLQAYIRPMSHAPSAANACINNLRQIDAAANEFALEHSLTNGDAIKFPEDLTPYIKLNSAGKIPPCPRGGVYHISKVGETPTCSLGTSVVPVHVLP